MAQIGPLRQRMIEDMTIRNLLRSTQYSYLYARSLVDILAVRRIGLGPRICVPISCILSVKSTPGRPSIRWPVLCASCAALRLVKRGRSNGL
jgi:hypothetical protein